MQQASLVDFHMPLRPVKTVHSCGNTELYFMLDLQILLRMEAFGVCCLFLDWTSEALVKLGIGLFVQVQRREQIFSSGSVAAGQDSGGHERFWKEGCQAARGSEAPEGKGEEARQQAVQRHSENRGMSVMVSSLNGSLTVWFQVWKSVQADTLKVCY